MRYDELLGQHQKWKQQLLTECAQRSLHPDWVATSEDIGRIDAWFAAATHTAFADHALFLPLVNSFADTVAAASQVATRVQAGEDAAPEAFLRHHAQVKRLLARIVMQQPELMQLEVDTDAPARRANTAPTDATAAPVARAEVASQARGNASDTVSSPQPNQQNNQRASRPSNRAPALAPDTGVVTQTPTHPQSPQTQTSSPNGPRAEPPAQPALPEHHISRRATGVLGTPAALATRQTPAPEPKPAEAPSLRGFVRHLMQTPERVDEDG